MFESCLFLMSFGSDNSVVSFWQCWMCQCYMRLRMVWTGRKQGVLDTQKSFLYVFIYLFICFYGKSWFVVALV